MYINVPNLKSIAAGNSRYIIRKPKVTLGPGSFGSFESFFSSVIIQMECRNWGYNSNADKPVEICIMYITMVKYPRV